MKNGNKKQGTPVVKPFLKGSVRDERTGKEVLSFFGLLLVGCLMSFLVCTMISLGNSILQTLINLAVEALLLYIFYNSAIRKGTDAVARGEILFQRQEKGLPYTPGEKALCFHPMKGFFSAFLGSLPLLICAVLLAVLARRQTTGAGVLPSWMSSYQRRSDIGDALAAYTVSSGLALEDVLRIIIRVAVMPFVSMVGAENGEGLLLMERLSPVLVLLPACAYGTGYLQGRGERTRIHTGIAESNRRRTRKERKARKARMAPRSRTPEQLN